MSISALAQEKKYQSLFWEISGNGLTKKSYMYGTMHVSDKVSFHLSDAFFEKLLASDYIANESEPNYLDRIIRFVQLFIEPQDLLVVFIPIFILHP